MSSWSQLTYSHAYERPTLMNGGGNYARPGKDTPRVMAEIVERLCSAEQCPECRDQHVIWMLGEEWPCPWCKPDEHNEKLIQLRIDIGELSS